MFLQSSEKKCRIIEYLSASFCASPLVPLVMALAGTTSCICAVVNLRFTQYYVCHFLNDNVAQAKFCEGGRAWQAGEAGQASRVVTVSHLPSGHNESPGSLHYDFEVLFSYSTRV